jgi:hypothetical protein
MARFAWAFEAHQGQGCDYSIGRSLFSLKTRLKPQTSERLECLSCFPTLQARIHDDER